ncbi:MAG: permease [Streptomycetales bacterium]
MESHDVRPAYSGSAPEGPASGGAGALDLAGRRSTLAGAAAFALVAVAAFTWAKWWPYAHKLVTVYAERDLGPPIIDGHPSAPSLDAAIGYTTTYVESIWAALVAGLLVAAAIEAFLPRRWLLRVLTPGHRGGLRGSRDTLTGGLASTLTMMCTCCTAPATVSLRRCGVSARGALAYWVGNPTLNPAVLAFMALVLPWQWVTVRLALGVVLVFGVTSLVARLAPAHAGGSALNPSPVAGAEPRDTRSARRFLRSLGRLSVTLVPEYLIMVAALGALHGWLLPLDFAAGLTTWGLLAAVALLAIGGTLFVIPTAAEIPIIVGLLAAGAGAGPAGALLLTLPAISLPSLVMIGGAFPRRVLVAMAAAVALLGVLSAGLLAVLT